MYLVVWTASLLLIAYSSVVLASSDGMTSSVQCAQRFRAIDDKADADVREARRLISLLQDEIDDPAVTSAAFRDHLRSRLSAAETSRKDILDKQHADLNRTRADCDLLRKPDGE